MIVLEIDLKAVAQTPIFTVPAAQRLLVNSVEVIIEEAVAVSVLATVRFGVTASPAEILIATQLDASLAAVGERQKFDIPTDVFTAGESIEFGVTIGSTATTHRATALLRGYLLDV